MIQACLNSVWVGASKLFFQAFMTLKFEAAQQTFVCDTAYLEVHSFKHGQF